MAKKTSPKTIKITVPVFVYVDSKGKAHWEALGLSGDRCKKPKDVETELTCLMDDGTYVMSTAGGLAGHGMLVEIEVPVPAVPDVTKSKAKITKTVQPKASKKKE